MPSDDYSERILELARRAKVKKTFEVDETKFIEYLLSLPKEDVLPTLEYAQKKYIKRLPGDVWESIANRVSEFLGDKKAKSSEKIILSQIKGIIGDYEPELILSMIKQESKFNPKAKSSAGAVGLMQLMPGTAEQMGITKAQRVNPLLNIKAGIGYINWIKSNFAVKTNEDLLHAYNAGPGNFKKGVKPSETKNYITKVIGYYNQYKANSELLKSDLAKLQGLIYPKGS